MRLRSLAVASILALTLFAVPPASAETCTPQTLLSGLNTVEVREDCSLEIGVLDGVTCVGDWGTTTERDVAGHTIRTTFCNGGLGHQLGDIIRPSTAGPVCPPVDETDPTGAVRVIVDKWGCNVTVVLLEYAACAPPLDGDVYLNAFYVVRLIVPNCGIDAPAAANTAAAPTCPTKPVGAPVAGEVYLESNCKAHAHALDTSNLCNFMPGVYPERHDVVDNGAAHVSYGACGFLRSDAAASAPCPETGAGLGYAGSVYLHDTCKAELQAVDLGVLCNKVSILDERRYEAYEDGRVRVYSDYCVLRTYESSAQWLPVCPDHRVDAGVAGEAGYYECEYNVHLVDEDQCDKVPNLFGYRRDVYDQGNVHVSYGACSFLGPRAATAGPCSSFDKQYGSARVARNDDCTHEVWLDLMSCPLLGSWKKVVGGPVGVYAYTCDGPDPRTMSTASTTCNGAHTDGYVRIVAGGGCATVTVGPPGCTTTTLAETDSVGVYLCDTPATAGILPSRTVTIDLPKMYDCVWGGSWEPVAQVGPVVVREYRCTAPVE